MPDQSPIALVISCEHAGNDIPDALDGKLRPLFAGAEDALASHRGWDPGTLDAAQYLAKRWAAPLFSTTVSRLVCDTNRRQASPALWSEWTRDLSQTDKRILLDSFYLPHRNTIEEHIRVSIERGCTVLHLAIHSFTPVWHGEKRNMDIGLLYDPTRKPERELAGLWRNELVKCQHDHRLRVRRNAPYTGVADGFPTFLRHRFPEKDYIGFEVEFNQALLDNGPFPAALLADTLDTARKALTLAPSNAL